MDPFERIKSLLEAGIETLTPEELAELKELTHATFDSVDAASAEAPTAQTAEQIDYLVEAAANIQNEEGRRETEATELKQRHTDAVERMKQVRTPAADPNAETEPATPAEPAAPVAAGPDPAATDQPADATAGVGEAAPIAASAPRGTIGGGIIPAMARVAGRPAPSPEVPRPAAFGAKVVTAAGLPGFGRNEPIDSEEALGQIMAETLTSLGGQVVRQKTFCAKMTWDYPTDRQLNDDASHNTRVFDAICRPSAPRYDRKSARMGQQALVATGGICLPVNVDYSVPTWSTADRPLRDALPSFQASRGGIQFVAPPDIGLSTLSAGGPTGAGTATSIWTEATDANPAGATKPVWVVPCGTEVTAYVNAVPTRVQFGNMQSRFAPEQVAANTQQAIAMAARTAEQELLSLMYAQSKQVKPAQYLGATRDLLASVDLLASQYRYSHRIPRSTPMTAVFPDWAQDLIRADLARELAHDNTNGRDVLAITDAQIEDWFQMRGINLVWTIDGLAAGTYGTGGSAITTQQFTLLGTNAPTPTWPGQSGTSAFMVAWLLYVEGSFQFLDAGRLDLGVVRDSILDATNDYETFVETFEGIAFRGLEAYQVQSTVLPTGGSAGTVAATSYAEDVYRK